jgi:uncharacterized membrane protein YfcA
LRVLLAAMVPCLAIGLTGLFVTTIGRLLLAVTHDEGHIEVPTSVPVGLALTVAIMVGCSIAAAISARMGPQRRRTPH